MMTSGHLFTRALVVLLAAPTLLGSSAWAKDLPSYDALDRAGRRASRSSSASASLEASLVRPGTSIQVDERLGVPTFVWAASRPGAAPGAAPPGLSREEHAARKHLSDYGAMYGLTAEDIQAAGRTSTHDTGRGAVIVGFGQRIGGIEVFRDKIRVVMDQQLNLVALSGYIPGTQGAGGESHRFELDSMEAAATAFNDYTGPAGRRSTASDFRPGGARTDGYANIEMAAAAETSLGLRLASPVRIKRVLFHLPDQLVPAWYLELQVGPAGSVNSDYYAYVVSAADGTILFRNNLTVNDSFSYRVWADTASPFMPFDGPQGTSATPHPTGIPDGTQPPFIAPNLVTLQNGPISTNDPWLPSGATVTTGNNADAYADIATPDGFTAGDLRATTTTPGVFDRTYDTSLAPSASSDQRMAAVTQLFFDVNFLHDWFYDSGFNEASRNAQTSNFGRGGLQNDSLRVEAQDFGGTNNANMSTPADGARPRMQMYVWTGIGHRGALVNAPASIAGEYPVGPAQFGPATFSTTGSLVLVNDGVGTTSDGCETPFANAAAIAGKIALVDRGICAFTVKVKNAQLNGAIGALVANNTTGGTFTMGGTDATIVVPSLMVSQTDGDIVRAQLGAGVNLTLTRDPAVQRDGTIDNQIVAHEWGHYISNRLVGNASGLTNSQGRGLGEGWGDFHALMITVRQEDAVAASNPDWSGVFGITGYVVGGGSNGPLPNTGYYFGIRRYPYSTDLTKNPLTFRHVSNGVPLPAGPPVSFGGDGSNNAEVHSTGEVWTAMLWECYASLLRDTLGATPRFTFDQARDRMSDYLVAAYKATPNAPTILEARDALLAAAAASDPNDYIAFWRAFARRGAGFGAVPPDRSSSANTPLVESFAPGIDLVFDGATLTDAVSYCDNDGFLDSGETGRLTITLRNAGASNFSSTTATVTSPSPGIDFPDGNVVTFPQVGPSGTTTAGLDVRLDGVTSIQQLDFAIGFTDPGFTIPGTVQAAFSRRGNLDDGAVLSATDDVESAATAWTPMGNPSVTPNGGWRRQETTASDHFWHGPDPFVTSDQYLVSPPMTVGSTGSFSFAIRHRWFFEFVTSPAVTNFDGGVIEISNNGGSTWTDVGAAAAGYNGTLAAGGTNVLAGRQAFVQFNAGYPAFVTTTVNLGSAFAGQTVRVRFRIGADLSGDDPGWDIDDIVFNNVTNTPFAGLVADRALCLDSDADGFADRDDCAPFDTGLWAAPDAASDLDVDTAGAISWAAPSQPGAAALVYDLLRGDAAAAFGSASCLESNDTDRVALDPSSPTGIYYYLVRSKNPCGANLGTDSAGASRTGATCP